MVLVGKQLVQKAFSPGEVAYTKLAIYQDELYIAFRDYTNSDKVSIMKFDGSNWISVSSTNLTENTCSNIDLKANDNYLLAFYSAENGSFGTVKKYNGITWEAVDTSSFPNGYMGDCNLNINNNTIYATFSGISGGKIGVVENSDAVLSHATFEFSINTIEIFPNPVSNILYIQDYENRNLKINLFQIDGKSVITKINNEIMDVSKVRNGIYILQILDLDSNIRSNKKIIIAK